MAEADEGVELLTAADLDGTGWTIGRSRLRDWNDTQSAALDAIVHYDDNPAPAPLLYPEVAPPENEVEDGRWFVVEHESGTRAFLRLQRQPGAVPEEVRITGIVFLPHRAGDPITSQHLREIPTAKIETAINKRLFAMKRVTGLTGDRIVLPSGRTIREKDLHGPIGDPRSTPDFYELVALQHAFFAKLGIVNPTATIAQRNGVAIPTAQAWVTKARGKGLLPPGRRGRAG